MHDNIKSRTFHDFRISLSARKRFIESDSPLVVETVCSSKFQSIKREREIRVIQNKKEN